MKILSRGPGLGIQNHESTLKKVTFDTFYIIHIIYVSTRAYTHTHTKIKK